MSRALVLSLSVVLASGGWTGCRRVPEGELPAAPEAPPPVLKSVQSPASAGLQKGTDTETEEAVAAKSGELWSSNWKEAKAKAAASRKDLLLNFTGSDWCRYCLALHREVFDTPAFKVEIGRSFVPVVVDFPMDDSRVTQAVAAQNAELQIQFGVRGYPSIFLADSSGKPYAQTGYREGGVESYLKHLFDLQEIRVRRDAAFGKAEGLKGVEKAALLKEGLETMSDSVVLAFYQEKLIEIAQLDPKDGLGMDARFGFQAAFDEFRKALEKKRAEGAAALVSHGEEFLKKRGSASGEQKQLVWLGVLNHLSPPRDNEVALKILERIRDVDPDSENGKIAGENVERLKKRMDELKGSGGSGAPSGSGSGGGEGSGERGVPSEKEGEGPRGGK